MASDHSQPLDGATLLRYVEEVADELPDAGSRRRLVVVGGALLAWVDLRDATHDVDSAEPLDDVLRSAVEAVAARHDLAPGWINDNAAGFVPAGFDLEGAELVLDHPRLLVLGAPLDHVFLMKILAARATDTDDIRRLWPRTSFRTPAEAADAFHGSTVATALFSSPGTRRSCTAPTAFRTWHQNCNCSTRAKTPGRRTMSMPPSSFPRWTTTAGRFSQNTLEPTTLGNVFSSSIDRERSVEDRSTKSVGGFDAVLATEVEQVPPLLRRIGDGDAVDVVRPWCGRGEERRVPRPPQHDARVGSAFGGNEASVVERERLGGVDDGERRMFPRDQVGSEIGRHPGPSPAHTRPGRCRTRWRNRPRQRRNSGVLEGVSLM